jgi:hypothetical protein
VTSWDATSVQWRSHTVGDWDGVILDFDGDDETTVAFTSPTMAFSVAVGEIGRHGQRVTGDLLEQQVVLRRLTRQLVPREIEFAWRDTAPPAGVNPYWIWVTQSDGEMAWTSPVYVERPGA